MTAGRTLSPLSAATATGMLAMADLRAGDVVADRYRIERLLGMGGMGVVYQAHDLELDIDVALKLLRPELATRPDAFERFRQELLLARQVSSPHVVRIHDLVRHGDVWLISMDFVPGQSLERRLDGAGPLEPEEAIAIVRQLALGLAAAHQRGVVHRDLKPANVLVTDDGEARITDFGVARSAGSTGITVSGVIIGTPEYLSPEQARADPVDARSDLYALGLLFHEMLTGTLPFRGGTPAEMLAQRIVRDPPPVDSVRKDIPAFAVRLCSKLLELRPSRRFQSAEDVVRAIDTRRVRGIGRRTRLALAASLAVVALAGAWLAATKLRAPPGADAANVASASLDVALPPFIVDGTASEEDRALAAGIRNVLAHALTRSNAIVGADAESVDRALAELGYDADAARRQRERVARTLRARRLMEGDLSKSADGSWRVRIALRDPAATEPVWQIQQNAADDSALSDALAALARDVAARLGDGAIAPTRWPSTGDLRDIGRLGTAAAPAADVIRAALADAGKSHDAYLWSAALRALDRANEANEAAVAARGALESLAGDDGAEAERVRAYGDLLTRKPEDAAKRLETLLAAAPHDHRAGLLLARAEGELGRFEDARHTLERIVAEDPRNVDAWFALGKFSIMEGDSKRAVDDYLSRAQVLANRIDDRVVQADVVNALGIGYQNLGQIDQAIESFTAAVRKRAELGDARGQATSLRNLSFARAIQGDFDAAQAALDKAKALVEPLGDADATAGLVNDIGALDEERGDYRHALESYRTALGMYQSLGDARNTARGLLNVGFAYYQIGEFDNAQVYWTQAVAAYKGFDDAAGSVNARMSLALAEIARGDFREARSALEGGLDEAERLQMAEARAIGAATLAALDHVEGLTGSALKRADVALEQFRQRDDPRGIVEMKLLESAIHIDLGDWNGAEAAIADLGADDVANREQAATLLVRRGEIALGRGNAGAAAERAAEAVRTATEAHSLGVELGARLLGARALAAGGKTRAASAELASARSALERYASVPLRLALAETALRVRPALADYRAASAELARLPSYVRAFELHALGAKLPGVGAADARDAAENALRSLAANAPDTERAALDSLAAQYGFAGTRAE